jgi:hypothetical protein
MDDYETITLDVATITLGEAADAEIASGLTLQQMLRSQAARKLLALYVHELRSSGPKRNWRELSTLRLLDGSSSTSPSEPDGVSETSKA